MRSTLTPYFSCAICCLNSSSSVELDCVVNVSSHLVSFCKTKFNVDYIYKPGLNYIDYYMYKFLAWTYRGIDRTDRIYFNSPLSIRTLRSCLYRHHVQAPCTGTMYCTVICIDLCSVCLASLCN